MTNLEKHILKLLLSNDCVIVPGFGGFIAHHIPASYDEKNNTFMPPYRTIGFNSRLVMNDSVLAQEYANCYDISYPEALKRIEYEAEEFERTIENAEGGYEMCGIGRLYILEDGRFDFLPNASGLTTPELYGFAAFEIEKRKDDSKNDAMTATCAPVAPIDAFHMHAAPANATEQQKHEMGTIAGNDAKSNTDDVKRVSVSIPIRVLHQIAAACVILLVMVGIPSRLGDASTDNLRKSSMNTEWLYDMMPKEITTGKPESLKPAETKKANDTGNNDTQLIKQRKCFTIVLASRVARTNADTYVERLHKNGMADAEVYTRNGMTMVIFKTFDKKSAAMDELGRINKKTEFANCWITEIRK